MTKQEVIGQLESFINNSKSHIKNGELGSIWHKGVQSLEKVIRILEGTPIE